jgi:hypothetical protein
MDGMDGMDGSAAGDGREFGDRMPAPITQPLAPIFVAMFSIPLTSYKKQVSLKKKKFGAMSFMV